MTWRQFLERNPAGSGEIYRHSWAIDLDEPWDAPHPSAPVQSIREPALLADRIERIEHAITAQDLARLLNVSRIMIFKQAKAGRIPSFRIGTSVRFCPHAVAKWLRRQ